MKIVISFVLITFFANIISITVFNHFALRKLENMIWSTHISANTTGDIINSLFIYVNVADFFFIAVTLFFMGRWMIRKTAGPLNRMSWYVRNMTEGDLISRIELRKNDEFQDVASEIDIMRKSLRGKFKSISNAYDDVSRLIGELPAAGSPGERILKQSRNIIGCIEKLDAEANTLKF
jgi:methyl-accepting chemotaxis protein